MIEPTRIFDEYMIRLDNREQVLFERLVSKLQDRVKFNRAATDEMLTSTPEYSELTLFVRSVFNLNKKILSLYMWETIIIGFIQSQRGTTEY